MDVTRFAIGSCRGNMPALAGLMTIKSAFLPTASEPMFSSSSRARAPLVVTMRRISWAFMTVGSSLQPLWIRLVSHISSTRSILLFEGAPSVPMVTQMPASSIFGTLANPSTRMAAAGLCETFTLRLAKSATSSSSSHTVCTARKLLSSTPRSSKWRTVPTP
ncbi:hypothetical protein SDC9_189382 [bioreactor metagenome]|uniref:Uncharacterized protein n=1 Tax=bioreactor metagenome TaxID=1076179 RepID=A0A645HSB5_9ZZZZ